MPKRHVLCAITDRLLYLRAGEKTYEVFGIDKIDRKVVLIRRKDLDLAIADAARVAQKLADIRKEPVQLDILSERFEQFSPVIDQCPA